MPLSPSLRRELDALIQAYDRGPGPVEQEARLRVAAGLPMTPIQIRAFAEACYPAEVRAFLDAHGCEGLHAGDLGRALTVSTAPARTPASHGPTPAQKIVRRRAGEGARGLSGRSRIAVVVMAVLIGALILAAAFTTRQPERERAQERYRPVPPAIAVAIPSPPAVPPEESPCLRRLRAGATSWCETALTGIATRGAIAEPSPCGDGLAAGRDTVRLALDRLLDEQATDTYTPADARERCAAAAKLAAPG